MGGNASTVRKGGDKQSRIIDLERRTNSTNNLTTGSRVAHGDSGDRGAERESGHEVRWCSKVIDRVVGRCWTFSDGEDHEAEIYTISYAKRDCAKSRAGDIILGV